MSCLRVRCHAVLAVVLGSFGLLQGLQAQPQPLKYTLTIFVDEGHGKLTGHVFVKLSDGKNVLYRGFYPNEAFTDTFTKGPAVLSLAGGEVRDDSQHPWDVTRTYNITKAGFENALRTIEATKQQGKPWRITCHCGDFAESIANAAGVPLSLPATLSGRDRPGVFAAYLLQHGGVTKVAAETLGSETQFMPPAEGTPEYDAWQRNQAAVAAETLNSSNGIVIDNQLVSDSPAPASGVTIETQVLSNPLSDGIEANAPVTPISIESSLAPDSPSGPTGHSAKGGGTHIDWAGVISDSLQILDAGVRAYDALHPQTISASPARATAPAPTNTLNRASTAPPQQTSHNTSTPPGTPGRGTPHSTPTPVPVSTPPPQNCSGGICCTPPSVPNPAAVACLNSPTPGCDHPNGPESWLQFCISAHP